MLTVFPESIYKDNLKYEAVLVLLIFFAFLCLCHQ